MKNGKSYNAWREQIGETYVHTGGEKFEEIMRKDPVFPGYHSWWGIDVRDWYETGCELLQSGLEEIDMFPAILLLSQSPRPYANVAFSIELSDILKDYEKAR